MSFEEEWAGIKARAAERSAPAEPSMVLAGANEPSPGLTPTPSPGGASEQPDLALDGDPVRRKASRTHKTGDESRGETKLHDAEAAGRTHKGWDSGAASERCVDAWQRRLREFADVIEDAADALTKAMDTQISDDGSVAADLDRAAKWMDKS